MTYDKAKKITEELQNSSFLKNNIGVSIGVAGKWVDIQYKRIDIIDTMALIEFCKANNLMFSVTPMNINQLEVTLFDKN